MAEIKGTQTEQNLKAAFAGESEARNKYTYFGKVARKEGYHYIAKLFEETAENEKQHAKDEFKALGGIGDTAANLREAMNGEHYENSEMYPSFAQKAKEEGLEDVARLFEQIAKVEKQHEARYQGLLKMVEQGTVYKREKPIKWKCGKCGFVHEGTEPPTKCPSCKHPKEYFEPEDMGLIG